MAGGVEIVNAALMHLGEDPIVSLDVSPAAPADSLAARMAARYPQVRDAVLRSYLWNSAEHYASLPLTPLPYAVQGLTHAGELPAGSDDDVMPFCLRLRWIEGEARWRVIGRRLHRAAAGPVLIGYTKRIDDPLRLDPLCFELIALRLALACSNALGTSETRSRRETLVRMAGEAEREARRVDAVEGSPPQINAGRDASWARPRSQHG